MRATVWARWASVYLGVLVAGCGDGEVPTPGGPASDVEQPPEGALTYFEHVKPIFDAKCVSCHAPGEIGPFDMTSFDALADYAGLIKAVVVDKVMPPWLAADGCADYVADRSLDDAQIAAIAKWADDGAYRGDVAREAPPLEAKPDFALSRVDLSLEMPVDYSALQTPDDYRCFVIDWPETSLKYVTGFRANPGTPAVVHHVIAFLAEPNLAAKAVAMDEAEEGPGYTCFGTANLGAQTAGSRGSDFPAGTGLPVEPGSKIVLQVHYNTFATEPQPDRTSIDVRLADTVEKEAWIQPWTNPQWILNDTMQIPAGQMDVEHGFSYDLASYLGSSFTMHSAGLHMHTLGTSGKLQVRRASGEEECLLDIPRWDFHWQGAYGFAEPKVFDVGDKLSIECHWDNPTPDDVSWGEGTGDEMCLGAFYLTAN
jgi:mono/diheme cytochrome c family protein